MINLPHLYAYIDPATTTYLIQIVSALVITLSVTIGVFFKRMHMSILNLRVKLSEWRIKIFTRKKSKPVEALKSTATLNEGVISSRWAFLWQDKRSRKTRLKLALLPIIGLVFSFMLFGVFELYVMNQDDFIFPFSEILITLLLYAFLATLVLSLLAVLLRGRVFDAYVTLCFAILVAGYVQGNFLNASLGELTGDQIAWDGFLPSLLGNTILWFFLLLLPFLLRYFKKKLWSKIIRGLSLLLILVQLISAISLLFSGSLFDKDYDSYFSSQGIYNVAKEKNIVVIVLDRLDNKYIQNVLKEDPRFFDKLDGFTRFTNNLSTYSQTFPSVANMLSGKVYNYDISKKEYLTDLWKHSDFFKLLKKDGYIIRLDAEASTLSNQAQDLEGLVDNVRFSDIKIHSNAVWKQFMLLSCFKYAPLSMKPFFWTSSDRFNRLAILENSAPPYVTDDPEYYKQLSEKGLSKSIHEKQFSYLHLNGSHAPYTMDENAQEVEKEKSSSTIQTKGSFHIVYEYLDQLRELGLYKDSTIVITGDHGARKSDTEDLDCAIVTALFVKPAGSEGSPLHESDAPVNSDNLRPFILQEAGLAHQDWGQSYFEVSHDDTARILRHRLVGVDGNDNRVFYYEIVGDANNYENWRLVDEHVSVY